MFKFNAAGSVHMIIFMLRMFFISLSPGSYPLCSTIIIHCPFATAIPEPLLIMLSLPFVLEDLAPVRF